MAPLPKLQTLVLLVLVVVMVLVELHGALNRCIYDEVQAQVSVVRAAHPLNQPKFRARRGQLLTFRQRTGRPGMAVEKRSFLRASIPSTPSPPQPIRIKTWTPKENQSPSEAGSKRLKEAVEEAVRVVSSLLSGETRITDKHLC